MYLWTWPYYILLCVIVSGAAIITYRDPLATHGHCNQGAAKPFPGAERCWEVWNADVMTCCDDWCSLAHTKSCVSVWERWFPGFLELFHILRISYATYCELFHLTNALWLRPGGKEINDWHLVNWSPQWEVPTLSYWKCKKYSGIIYIQQMEDFPVPCWLIKGCSQTPL